ncbi:MAG: capsule assembly Wzi family protein [Breznakibacter sp.]
MLQRQTLLFCFLLFFGRQLMAQGRNDSLQINLEWTGVAGNRSLQPLWNYANQWGIYSAFDKNESVLVMRAKYRIVNHHDFSLEAGVAGVAKGLFDDGFLHEGYLKGGWKMLELQAGLMAYTPIEVNDRLTSGSFLMSSNARPIPRVGIGIFNYYALPFTGKRVAIRGGIYQGWPMDDANPKSTRDVLLHEKFAYVRWNRSKLKPYAGLTHSAFYGGTLPDGKKIEIDFWATFRAAGSANVGGGEATNAAGAHLGLWDFGLDYDGADYFMKLYYQKPFADASGMRLVNGRNRDHVLGLYCDYRAKKLLSAWSLEWVKTDYQSGSGLADPLDPETGQGLWPGTITDANCSEWMANRFPGVETNGWDVDDVYEFLKHEWNHGQPYGGRDTYMNNGMYWQGWTHKGLSTGTPLLHTAQMARAYAPDGVFVEKMNFVNNRVVALHVGGEGYFNDRLSYRLKYTCSWNKGSYVGTYVDHYSWQLTPDYFFDDTKVEHYTFYRMDYRVGVRRKLTFFGSVAYDFGELYRSLGGHLGVKFDFKI